MTPETDSSARGDSDEPIVPVPAPQLDSFQGEELDEEAAQELVEAAARGEGKAVDRLLERHLPGLRAFVRLRSDRAVRAKESSSDLVQSVCREVIQGADNFEYRGMAAFKGWLFTAALRKIIEKDDYYSAQKRDVSKNVPLQNSSAEGNENLLAAYSGICSPSQAAQSREELERVEKAFDELPDEYREVITLARIAGLSHAEIAQQLGRSEPACRQLLKRAMVRLAVLLERT